MGNRFELADMWQLVKFFAKYYSCRFFLLLNLQYYFSFNCLTLSLLNWLASVTFSSCSIVGILPEYFYYSVGLSPFLHFVGSVYPPPTLYDVLLCHLSHTVFGRLWPEDSSPKMVASLDRDLDPGPLPYQGNALPGWAIKAPEALYKAGNKIRHCHLHKLNYLKCVFD